MGPPAPPLGRDHRSYRQLQKFTHSSNVQRCICVPSHCALGEHLKGLMSWGRFLLWRRLRTLIWSVMRAGAEVSTNCRKSISTFGRKAAMAGSPAGCEESTYIHIQILSTPFTYPGPGFRSAPKALLDGRQPSDPSPAS